MFETLILATDPRGVATLTLNRPNKHNAMSAQMMDDLAHAARQLDRDKAVRVVVMKGAGRSFCAGGDLGWMRDQMGADTDARVTEAHRIADMLGALNAMSKPLIAQVHGNAVGGGLGLCCVADKVFAADTSVFGLTETKLGLMPATIGPYVVARMGGGHARSVFMSSRLFDAAEAQRLGVVAKITTAQDLAAEVEVEVQAYLKCAPDAVAESKEMVLDLGGAPDKAAIDASIAALLKRWDNPETAQGIAAFFDKKPPPWA
ncbi:crotonase/enoyl-CoA hydratase family protein [Octadecabacter sp. G9-8]|uniref:Crotonase/enoyl-CoA hydratase family protein n=1 Tax=Octadecabacter dasysiphoniae TaxID=2909341 RepID=A0ABS9CXZ3_9RHOB|nr:crotonase/enoyl-CoA hydratase family protein [Octadecabacter dasysiphoniae]MCF2872108.1 crotonase/enoyl-CoA hydratase family protein [Octadecabacter dasysiphoniae]